MSRTQYLLCTDTNECIWIGQSPNGIMEDDEAFVERGYIYTGEENTMRELGKFLYTHHGKNLKFVDEWYIIDLKDQGVELKEWRFPDPDSEE